MVIRFLLALAMNFKNSSRNYLRNGGSLSDKKIHSRRRENSTLYVSGSKEQAKKIKNCNKIKKKDYRIMLMTMRELPHKE